MEEITNALVTVKAQGEKFRKEVLPKIFKFIKEALFILIVLAAFSAGYVAKGYYSEKFPSQDLSTQSLADVSTSISDRGELIVLNRHNGKYILYSDSVLYAMYHQYRAKVSYTKESYIPAPSGGKK